MWNRHVFSYNYSSSHYPAFSLCKIDYKTWAEQNQVCEVRLIPELKLFHFQEYGPLNFHEFPQMASYVHFCCFLTTWLLPSLSMQLCSTFFVSLKVLWKFFKMSYCALDYIQPEYLKAIRTAIVTEKQIKSAIQG